MCTYSIQMNDIHDLNQRNVLRTTTLEWEGWHMYWLSHNIFISQVGNRVDSIYNMYVHTPHMENVSQEPTTIIIIYTHTEHNVIYEEFNFYTFLLRQ